MADINTQWLKNLKEQIEAIPDCKSLNKLIAWLKEMFMELIEDILEQIAKLVGMVLPPTSLAKIIKYLKNLATQYLGPYLAAIRQMVIMIKAFADVLKAIQEKLANLHCSISASSIINQLKIDMQSKAYQKLYSGNSSVSQLLDIETKLKNGVPPLSVIASEFGVNIDGLPAVAMQYGGTLPFMSKMLDKYQPAIVPDVPAIPTFVSPTDIILENPAPTIAEDGIVPSSGRYQTLITITGSGFLEGVTVTMGDVECGNVEIINGHIECTVPGLVTGFPYAITVTNTDGQSATLDQAFAYTGRS